MDHRLLQAADGIDLTFSEVTITFEKETRTDLFALKNNKTVAQTLVHPRYVGLSKLVLSGYATRVDTALGTFVHQLKEAGDPTYRRFLNKHGDLA